MVWCVRQHDQRKMELLKKNKKPTTNINIPPDSQSASQSDRMTYKAFASSAINNTYADLTGWMVSGSQR